MHEDRLSTIFNSMIYPQQNMLRSLHHLLLLKSYSCQKYRSFQSFLFLKEDVPDLIFYNRLYFG